MQSLFQSTLLSAKQSNTSVMPLFKWLNTGLLLILPLAANAQAKQTAHEHGVAQASIAVVQDQVLIEVSSPLYNLLGFEHLGHHHDEQDQIKQQLRDKMNLALKANAEAQCQLQRQAVTMPNKQQAMDDHHGHEHSHNHDHHDHKKTEQTHKDIQAEYELKCKQANQLTQFDATQLFKNWPNLQTLRVEWVTEHQQSANVLRRENTLIKLQ